MPRYTSTRSQPQASHPRGFTAADIERMIGASYRLALEWSDDGRVGWSDIVFAFSFVLGQELVP